MGSARVPLPIDYTQLMMTSKEIIGNFMYPADAPAQLLRLAAAAEPGGPLVVVTPVQG